MLSKDLQSIGFSKNLAEIYLCLAQLGGQAKAGAIINKLGIHRNIVYVGLNKLIKKKLITKIIQRGVMVYKILDPARIMNEIREKEHLIVNIIEEIEAMKKHVDTQEVVVYEGLEGFREYSLSVLQRLNKGEKLQVLGSIGDKWFEFMGKEKYRQYEKLQVEKKIHWQMISYFDSNRDIEITNKYPDLCEIKVLPQTYKNPTNINIFGNTVALQIFTEPFSVIEIKNKSLADTYRNYFDLLWNNNTWTLRGEQGVKILMDDTLNHSDVYWIGGNSGIERYFPKIWDEYKRKRIEKKVFWHDLITPEMKLSGSKPDETIYDDPYYEYKFLPKTVAGPHVIGLYGNKMVSIVWKDDAVINIIEDKEVMDGYKKYFKYLWDQNTVTYKGWDEVRQLFFEELLPAQKVGEQTYCLGGGYGMLGEDQRVVDFYIEYNTARTKKKSITNILFYELHREKAQREFVESGDKDMEYANIKFLPTSYYSPLQIHLIDGKTIIITWGEEPLATVYEEKEIYNSFKKQFDLLWDQEVFTYHGWEAIDQIMRLNLKEGYTHDVYRADYCEGTEKEREDVMNYYIEYHKKTAYLKPKKRYIFYNKSLELSKREIAGIDTETRKNIEVRYISDDYFVPIEIHVFKDKVINIFSFGEPIATMYTNPKIIEAYKKQFDLWWQTASK